MRWAFTRATVTRFFGMEDQIEQIREQLAMIGLGHIPEEAIQAFVSEELDRLYPPPFTTNTNAPSEGLSDHFSDKDEPWREALPFSTNGFKRKVASDVSRCGKSRQLSVRDQLRMNNRASLSRSSLCSRTGVVKITPQQDGDEKRFDKRPEVRNLQTKKVSAAQFGSDDESFDVDLIQKESHRLQTFASNARQEPKPAKAAPRSGEATHDEKENIEDRPWRASLSPNSAARAPGVIHARPWTAALGKSLSLDAVRLLRLHPLSMLLHCWRLQLVNRIP
jgi:hypothetical protein